MILNRNRWKVSIAITGRFHFAISEMFGLKYSNIQLEKKKLVTREQLKQFIKENHLKTTDDIQAMLKEVFSDTLQEMLEAEMNYSLGYEKHDDTNKQTDNRRNGHSKKTVRSEYGDVEIEIPRDRDNGFDPIIVKKHQGTLDEG